jgi:hypothetical protein
MLLCYAQEMGAIFHPYVEQIMQVVLPMLKFYLNDGVRYATASVIPVLVQCWIKANYRNHLIYPAPEKIQALWSDACEKLLEAMHEEEDIAVVCTLYSTMVEAMKIMSVSSMTPVQMQKLTQDVISQLEQYMIRSLERQSMRFSLRNERSS